MYIYFFVNSFIFPFWMNDNVDVKYESFFSKNKAKYELFSSLKDSLVNLSKDQYDEVIKLIQNNKQVFFRDHADAICLYFTIVIEAEYNFKSFELYLDICIHFTSDFKNAGLTEFEMIKILLRFPNGISYLFSKKFFTIESIIEMSFINDLIFINFLPEIEDYDSEYSLKREKTILKGNQDYLNYVKNNRQTHIMNRNLNYHPSHLHKLIREDDVESFQLYLAKNNIKINHKIEYSHYERSHTIENELSLIKIAAIYGSINTFKYLWIQNDIEFDNNLLSFAYFGQNFDIIHLCEKKCHSFEACDQPIFTNRKDLLYYYIDNFSDEIIENCQPINEGLKSFVDDENNYFQNLNYTNIGSAIFALNLDIIKSCFPKIIYILKNIKMEPEDEMSFFINSYYELDLFKLFWQIREKMPNDDEEFYNFNYILLNCMQFSANDAFIYVLKSFVINNDSLRSRRLIKKVFLSSFRKNHDLTNYLLDLQISGEINIIPDFDAFVYAARYYNEDIFVKLFKIDESIANKILLETNLLSQMLNSLSTKMICSLLKRFSFLEKESLRLIADFFLKEGNQTVYKFIQENMI